MTWLSWPFRMLGFTLWFARALVVANVQVLRDNLTPAQYSTPGIARYSTRCETDGELTLLAALITLTPGTLTLGTETTAEGRRVLYVHAMYAEDADEARSELGVMEQRMLRAVRRKGGTT
ncbi:sodium:proton antiporter [Saccharomonospora sp. CUA-673]|uniref:Na+/H+ antiporter subunit E n=1 Tax=Saccharomonospora sp. CUA-673 TaxID=1904969 RepID=UPI000961E593|nr:Na+/H+ antiporter subunit E [Saccharomonospora sp. CUA-673]OLT46217.1 sodium:proton antiporter [Saccharomonospora sp. CUA-673]